MTFLWTFFVICHGWRQVSLLIDKLQDWPVQMHLYFKDVAGISKKDKTGHQH